MNDRTKIFSAISDAIKEIPKVPYPEYDSPSIDLVDQEQDKEVRFKNNLERSSAKFFTSIDDVVALLKAESQKEGVLDKASDIEFLRDSLKDFILNDTVSKETADQNTFAFSRVDAGIAESGSLIISDKYTSSRLTTIAPLIHIAVLDRASIFTTVEEAIADFGDTNYITFITGPSKTADVEGILIEGVHGPAIQGCLLV